jgi:hypothetical protein
VTGPYPVARRVRASAHATIGRVLHGRLARAREWWSHYEQPLFGVDLAPPGRRTGWLETLLLVIVGFVVSFPRPGAVAFRGVVWAEDGALFLQDAYLRGAWHSLLEPYAGYLLLAPRLIVTLVLPFPLAWHGVLIAAAGALVHACVGAFVFHVVRAHARGRVAALVAFVGVVLVPVGAQVLDNLANTHWFLLVAGCLAPLWTPYGRAARVASLVAIVAATTSNPFGGLAVGVAALAWIFVRREWSRTVLIAGLAGFFAQLLAMLAAPPRRESDWDPKLDPPLLAVGYLRRILGDGVFGARIEDLSAPATSVVPGLVAVVLLAMLSVISARRHGVRSLAVPALMGGLSMITFAVTMALTGIEPRYPQLGGRYFVTPAMFLFVAMGLLIEHALVGRRARRLRWTPSTAVALVLTLSIGYGLVVSWSPPDVGRGGIPAWSDEVDRARQRCEERQPDAVVKLRIAPHGWHASVPCARLTQ